VICGTETAASGETRMTGRQRVLATLDRQTPDFIPFDIGGTSCSGIHSLTYRDLRACLGLPDRPIVCGCIGQLIAKPDDDVMDALGVDVEALWFGARETKIWNTPFGVELIVPEHFNVEDLPDGSSVVTDTPKGRVCAKRASGTYYFDPVATPLADITSPAELDEWDALFQRWDYPSAYDEPLDVLADRARKQYEATDRAVVALWSLHYLQTGQITRGFEQFLVDLMIDRDLARAILDKLHQAYLNRVDTFLDAFGDWFDVVFLTDDLGTQQSCMISPATYKEMIFPYISEIVGRIKSRGKKVLMHSCGAVSQFIPLMIEMGVDALNPVQVSAEGMNPAELVREYGRDIAFWGGGCDTQHALNAADPEVVRSDVRKRLEQFGPNASLVFTQVHNIQYDVPAQNVLAMRDEFFKQTRP
jgi:uroporphyrinogen decarboxylase